MARKTTSLKRICRLVIFALFVSFAFASTTFAYDYKVTYKPGTYGTGAGRTVNVTNNSNLRDFYILKPSEAYCTAKAGYRYVSWRAVAADGKTMTWYWDKVGGNPNQQLYNGRIWVNAIQNWTLTGNVEKIKYAYNFSSPGVDAQSGQYDVESATFTFSAGTKLGYKSSPATYTVSKGSTGDKIINNTWVPNSGEITYDANGGDGNMEPLSYTYETGQSLDENQFTKLGYLFAGWNTERNGSGESYSDKEVIDTEFPDIDQTPVTLYAQWEGKTSQIKFNANGGDGHMEPQDYQYDNNEKLDKNDFDNKGFYFLGWNTKADGSGTWYTDEANVNKEFPNLEEEPVTLYAQWRDEDYTIHFDGNSHTSGEMADQIAKRGEDTALNENEFVKNDYVFKEWNTKPDGSGKSYKDKDTFIWPKDYLDFDLEGVAYAVFDSADNSLTFFRDTEGLYTNRQVVGTKTYYTGFENTTGTGISNQLWGAKRSSVQSVTFNGVIRPISTAAWFYDMSNLTTINGLEKLDTSSTRFFGGSLGMFEHCSNLTTLDLSYMDTSKAENMRSMFYGCSKLNTTLNLAKMPSSYSLMFASSAATESGSGITLTYSGGVTSDNIDTLVNTKWPGSNVTNGGAGTIVPSPYKPQLKPVEYPSEVTLHAQWAKGEFKLEGDTVANGYKFEKIYTENGMAELSTKLGHMQNFSIFDLDAGSIYEVKEDGKRRYKPTFDITEGREFAENKSGEAETGKDLSSGEEILAGNMKYSFTNTKGRPEGPSLSFEKKVTGDQITQTDKDKYFTFRYSITGLENDADYPYVHTRTEGKLKGEGYAVFDSADNSLTFFRDTEGLYTNGQVVGTKTYYTGFENTTGTGTSNQLWNAKRTSVRSVTFNGVIRPISTAAWFNGMSNITAINGLEKLDTSSTRFFGGSYGMFENCSNLETLDLSHMDTSKAENMGYMFYGCKKLNTTFNVAKMPSSYNGIFGNSAATESGSRITVTYSDYATSTNVDALVGTKAATANVTNGGEGTNGQTEVPEDAMEEPVINGTLTPTNGEITGTVLLKTGESFMINNLPEGAKYNVTEVFDTPWQYKTSYKVTTGEETTVTDSDSNVGLTLNGLSINRTGETDESGYGLETMGDKNVNYLFTNAKAGFKNLTVSKQVKVDDVLDTNYDQEFTITATFGNLSPNTTYVYGPTGTESTFTADDKGNAVIELTLTSMSSIRFTNIPGDVEYDFTESACKFNPNVTVYENGNAIYSQDGSFNSDHSVSNDFQRDTSEDEIGLNGNQEVRFTNSKTTIHSLTITKDVAGVSANENDSFSFSFDFMDFEGGTLGYRYIYYTLYDSDDNVLNSGTYTIDDDNRGYRFNLKSGQKMVLDNIPEEWSVRVSEQGTEGYIPSYTIGEETNTGRIGSFLSTGMKLFEADTEINFLNVSNPEDPVKKVSDNDNFTFDGEGEEKDVEENSVPTLKDTWQYTITQKIPKGFNEFRFEDNLPDNVMLTDPTDIRVEWRGATYRPTKESDKNIYGSAVVVGGYTQFTIYGNTDNMNIYAIVDGEDAEIVNNQVDGKAEMLVLGSKIITLDYNTYGQAMFETVIEGEGLTCGIFDIEAGDTVSLYSNNTSITQGGNFKITIPVKVNPDADMGDFENSGQVVRAGERLQFKNRATTTLDENEFNTNLVKTNIPLKTALNIKKNVTGNLGDLTKQFEYEVKLSGLKPNKKYAYEKANFIRIMADYDELQKLNLRAVTEDGNPVSNVLVKIYEINSIVSDDEETETEEVVSLFTQKRTNGNGEVSIAIEPGEYKYEISYDGEKAEGSFTTVYKVIQETEDESEEPIVETSVEELEEVYLARTDYTTEKSFTTDENGEAIVQFKLTDDAEMSLANLPLNIKYQITEKASNHIPRWEVTEGEVSRTEDAKTEKEVSISTPEETLKGTTSYLFTNHREIEPTTAGFGLLIGMLVLTLTGLTVMFVKRRRRRKELAEILF